MHVGLIRHYLLNQDKEGDQEMENTFRDFYISPARPDYSTVAGSTGYTAFDPVERLACLSLYSNAS
jgi:hypothetical protein